MPLARTYDPDRRKIVVSLQSVYEDRAARWSDIREYLPFLHGQAASRPGCRVLEFGTRKGNSTLAFLAGAEKSGGHVWSSDINDVTRDPDGMLPWARHPQWTFTCGDDMDPAVQARLPAECDVLFIDTSHEYQHTLDECRAFMPRVAPGGVALFHDTNLMLNISGRNTEIPPVRQALDEYCAETGLRWENMPGEYGMGVIRP